MVKGAEEDDDGESSADLIGTRVRTKSGRTGKIVAFDPNDRLLEIKVEFDNDGLLLFHDWMSGDDVDPEEVVCENIGNDQDALRKNWLDCIRTRRQPDSNVELGTKVMVIVDLASRSMWEGKAFEFDPATMTASAIG